MTKSQRTLPRNNSTEEAIAEMLERNNAEPIRQVLKGIQRDSEVSLGQVSDITKEAMMQCISTTLQQRIVRSSQGQSKEDLLQTLNTFLKRFGLATLDEDQILPPTRERYDANRFSVCGYRPGAFRARDIEVTRRIRDYSYSSSQERREIKTASIKYI